MIFTDHKETPFFMRSVLMRSRVRLLFEKYLNSHVCVVFTKLLPRIGANIREGGPGTSDREVVDYS